MTEIRFVELVRVSTGAQAEKDTPALQRTALDRLAESRPGVRVERIEELGVSGAAPLEARPAIRRLRALTDAKAYDELRVYNVDRITRSESVTDRLAIYSLVQAAGAVIVDAGGRVIDPCDASGLGEIDYYLQTLFASRERQRIKARTQAGRAEAARKGRWIGGPWKPYAYSHTMEAGWAVNEEHAAIVRRIYSEVERRGVSLDMIADALNRDGIPSPGGTLWRGSSIGRIVRHPVYVGDGLAVEMAGQRHTIPLPALVDRGQWNRAQAALSSRWQRPIREHGSIEALIRGIALCPCGQPFDVTTWKTTGSARKTIYICRSARRRYGPRCPNTGTHQASAVDLAVWAAIVAQLRDPRLLREAAEAAGGGDDGDTWEKQAASCDRERKKLERHEAEVLRMRAKGLLSESAMETRLREIAGQRATLDRTAEVASNALAHREGLGRTLRDAQARVDAIRERLDSADYRTQRDLVLAVVPMMAGYGVTIHVDGRIVIRGALSLAEGEPFQQESPLSRSVRSGSGERGPRRWPDVPPRC